MRALLLEHGMVTPVGRRHSSTGCPQSSLMLSTDCPRASWSYSIDSGNDGSRSTLRSVRPRATWRSGPINHPVSLSGDSPRHRSHHRHRAVAAVGDGRMFARGRDMAAWLGLVPRQHSTGGRPTLGSISKRGTRTCAALHPRRPVFVRPLETRPVVARPMAAPGRDASTASGGHRRVANTMVRICWKVLTSEEEFRAYPARVA